MTDFTKIELLENKIENLEEKIYCVHHYLTNKNIPMKNENGEIYSIVGRIHLLEMEMNKKFSDRETELLKQIP